MSDVRPRTDGTAVQEAINAYWDERAEPDDADQRDERRRPADDAVWSEIWSSALGPERLQVLDIGTGSGHAARLVAALGHDVLGIDLSQEMLTRARVNTAGMPHPPRFEVGDAVDPPVLPASQDAIIGRYVMWTVRTPTVALGAWRTALRPGGVLALADSTWFPGGIDEQSTPQFRSAYDDAALADLPLAEASTIEATAELVRAAGFIEVSVTPLDRVRELDERYGVAPGHEVRTQYLVRAVSPRP